MTLTHARDRRRTATRIALGLFVTAVALIGAARYGVSGQVLSTTPEPAKGYLVPAGTGESFKPEDERIEVKVNSVQTDGRFSVNHNHYKAGFKVVPHFHQEHAEAFYILSGKVEWTMGSETKVMGPGGFAYAPPDVVHSMRIVENAQMLMIYTPGGYEYHLRREAQYTPEQLKDPKVLSQLRALNDFNPVAVP